MHMHVHTSLCDYVLNMATYIILQLEWMKCKQQQSPKVLQYEIIPEYCFCSDESSIQVGPLKIKPKVCILCIRILYTCVSIIIICKVKNTNTC